MKSVDSRCMSIENDLKFKKNEKMNNPIKERVTSISPGQESKNAKIAPKYVNKIYCSLTVHKKLKDND